MEHWKGANCSGIGVIEGHEFICTPGMKGARFFTLLGRHLEKQGSTELAKWTIDQMKTWTPELPNKDLSVSTLVAFL